MSTRKFAQDTKVPSSRSQSQLRDLLMKYGADGFASAERANGIRLIAFEYQGIQLRFTMQCPVGNDASEKEERRMWRSLCLVAKAKLEAVASGISTFEEEFIGWVVMANGQTIAKQFAPQLASMDRVPLMLPGVPEGSFPTTF